MSKYSEWNSALKAVIRMERERKRKEANDAKMSVDGSSLSWEVIKQRTWHFLTRPQSSLAAQVCLSIPSTNHVNHFLSLKYGKLATIECLKLVIILNEGEKSADIEQFFLF